MNKTILLIISLIYSASYGQYPFEKYNQPKYDEFDQWDHCDAAESKQRIDHTLVIDNFFEGEALTIQLTSFTENVWEDSQITLWRGGTQIQKFCEDMLFIPINSNEPVRMADLNGDGLKDLKLVVSYMGNGLASLNVRVIYLMQEKGKAFSKISFTDKMDVNRPERDFDNDGIFEIVTMKLNGHEGHSYWAFNIFEFSDSGLRNCNHKDDYPIMVQYLYRDNFEITDKLDRSEMKSYALTLPIDYDVAQ